MGICELDDGVHHQPRDALPLGRRVDADGADFVFRPRRGPHPPHAGVAESFAAVDVMAHAVDVMAHAVVVVVIAVDACVNRPVGCVPRRDFLLEGTRRPGSFTGEEYFF